MRCTQCTRWCAHAPVEALACFQAEDSLRVKCPFGGQHVARAHHCRYRPRIF